MKKIFMFFSLFITLVLAFSLKINAATSDVMFVTTNIGEDASTEMLVNYHAKVSGTVVEYTAATDAGYASKQTVTPVSTAWSYTNDETYTPFSERFVCKATLSGLQPGTEYRYRIKTQSGAYSDEYYFKTASGRGTTTFLFLTDSQAGVNDYTYYNNLIAKAKELKPDTSFVVHTGDITDRSGQPEQWNGFFSKGTNLSMMPIASTPGNHEYYTTSAGSYDSPEIYNQFFNNPDNGPEARKNSSYYFTYNNILFVMLDTVKTDANAQQKEWFKNVVTNNMNRVVVVGMHVGPFTGGGSYADSAKAVYAQWSPLFEQLNVDLVLSGHEHNYAPSKPLYNKELADNGLGVSYLVGPASGTKLGGYNRTVPFTGSLTVGDILYDEQIGAANNRNKAGVIIKAGGNEIEVSMFDINGIVHTYKIAAKRPNSITELSHEDFLDSLTIVPDMANNTAKVTWSEYAYGNVKTIKFTGTITKDMIISSPLFTECSIGNIYEGNDYPVKAEIVFKDDTTLTKDMLLDLTPEEEPETDPGKTEEKKGCLSGTSIVSLATFLSALSACAFVFKRRG